VSDFWCDLCPTAWNAVGSTFHLQQPDWQGAALRMEQNTPTERKSQRESERVRERVRKRDRERESERAR